MRGFGCNVSLSFVRIECVPDIVCFIHGERAHERLGSFFYLQSSCRVESVVFSVQGNVYPLFGGLRSAKYQLVAVWSLL